MGIFSMFNHGLPKWARLNKRDGYVEVDPDVVYPLFLKNLNLSPTKANLEKARLTFTRRLNKLKGPNLNLRILKKDGKWALKNFV